MTLHDALHDAGGNDAGPLDLDALHGRARSRSRRRRSAIAAGSMAALLVVGGLAWAGTRSDGTTPKQQVTADGGAGSNTDPGATDPNAPAPPGPPVTTWSVPGGVVVVQGDPTAGVTITTAPADPSTDPSNGGVTITTAVGTASTAPPVTTTAVTPQNPGGPTGPGGTVIGGTRTTGTYHGNEQYRIGGTCPEVTQHLLAVFTTADGAEWQYDAHICGRTEGDKWYGTGTGVFTVPGGDTITVSIDEVTPYPTTGVPYFVTVTGGTGAYAKASGRCDMTIHITPKGFGSQDQDGNFTCDVAQHPAG